MKLKDSTAVPAAESPLATSVRQMMSAQLTRRTLFGTIGGGAAALALAACTNQSGSDTATSSGNHTITFAGYASSAASFTSMSKAFMQSHKDITVKVQGIPAQTWGELLQAISVNIAGGKSPDVADIASEGQRAFIDNGVVLSIDDYLKRDAAKLKPTLDDIDPRLVATMKVKGKTWGLPTVWNSMVVYYNKKVLASAGVEPPTDNWTVEDFISMSQKVVSGSGGKSYGYAFSSAYFNAIVPWMLQYGGNVLNGSWTKSRMNDPSTVKGVQLLHDFIYKYKISPSLDAGLTDSDLFIQNKLAFLTAGLWDVNTLKAAGLGPDDYDVVQFPRGTASKTLIGVGAAPIFSESKSQDAAWEFSSYLTDKHFQQTWVVQDGWSIPASKSAFNIMLKQTWFPKNGKIFYELLNNSVLVPAPAQYGDIESVVLREFSSAMANGKTVEQSMKDADAEVTKALKSS